MRNRILYLIIIGGCLLSSCNLNRKSSDALPIELIQAENIMYENPDSALQILQGMVIPLDKEAHATWALLLTQAKYRCLIEQSDSLANIAYDYFIKSNNSKRKSLVLYLKGGIFYERNQYDNALRFYIEADKENEMLPNDTLGYLINSHICMIYAYQELYEYALEYGWKANKYAMNSKHINYLVMSYIRIARANGYIDLNEAIKYYEKAISIADEYKIMNLKASASIEVAGIYKHDNIKNYPKALLYVKEAMRIRTKNTDQTYMVLGDLYRKMNELDSAYYYLGKAANSSNIHTSRSAYQSLYYMSKNMGRYKQAVDYSSKMWKMQDSIAKIASNKALIEMQEKYNQQKIINEKNQAERKGMIVLCVSIILIAVIILCYQWKLIRQKKELEAKREELNRLISRLNENKQTIAKNIARIEELEKTKEDSDEQQKSIEEMQCQNDSLGNENRNLQNKIEEYAATMAAKSKELEELHALSEMNLYLHKRELFLCAELLKKDEFINKLKKHPKALDAVQWEETIGRTNTIYDNYTIRLRNQIPELTENDIRICCLIKLSFSNVEIASILGISSASVSRQKLRLKDRITQKVGPLEKNLTLDLWLKEY